MSDLNRRPSRQEDIWLTISVLLVLVAAVLPSAPDETWRMIVVPVCVLAIFAVAAKRLWESKDRAGAGRKRGEEGPQ